MTRSSPWSSRACRRSARWRYGYHLSRETGLASGTLYPILMRLSGQHLLETGWEPSDQPGRPPRHTYRLTSDGFAPAEDRLSAQARKARGETAPFIPRQA